MPTIDLGSVVGPQGPQGPQGATGATGAQGAAGPNQINGNTSTTLSGVLAGNGSTVTTKAVDSTPDSSHTDNLISSAGVANALAKEILYYKDQVVSPAQNAQIMIIPATGTDDSITTNTVVIGCVFADPAAVSGSDITWRSYEGYITFSGTCFAATTANVTLGRKGN